MPANDKSFSSIGNLCFVIVISVLDIFAQASSKAVSGAASISSSEIPSSRIKRKDFGFLMGVEFWFFNIE